MKRLLVVLSISICLVLVCSLSVLAGTAEVTAYADTYGLGVWNYYNENTDTDDGGLLNGFIVGADIAIDKFKLGFEYEDAEPQKGDLIVLKDYTTSIIKGGLRVCSKDRLNVDVTLGYYEKEYVSKSTISGLLVGVDGLWNISERMFLQASLGLSGNGEYKNNLYEENAVIMVETVRFNYMVTNNFGFGAGLRYHCYIMDSGDYVVGTGGLTVGTTVRF